MYLKNPHPESWLMYYVLDLKETWSFVLTKIKNNSQKLESTYPLKTYTLRHNKNYKRHSSKCFMKYLVGVQKPKSVSILQKSNCIGWTITLKKLRLQFYLISAYKSHIYKNLFGTILSWFFITEPKELKLTTNFKKLCHQSVMWMPYSLAQTFVSIPSLWYYSYNFCLVFRKF